jgi:glutathione S-transferase
MMKLYYAPGFSSLAGHIALLEAGLAHELVRVDIVTKQTETGGSFLEVNPKGYVPALLFEDGELLTENVAILAWIADRAPALAPAGTLGRSALIEMLSFIATEIHKRFPLYLTLPEAAQPMLREQIAQWIGHVAGRLTGDYLFGNAFSAADAYLFVMVRGASELGFTLPAPFPEYVARIEARPSVREALRRETRMQLP